MVIWELLEDQHHHQMTSIQKIKKIDSGVLSGSRVGIASVNCTFYQDARSNLLKKLKLFLPHMDTMRLTELTRICVAGLDSLSFDFNYGILLATAEYIRLSKRFVIVT